MLRLAGLLGVFNPDCTVMAYYPAVHLCILLLPYAYFFLLFETFTLSFYA
jgi:hypothetical protein